MLYLFLILQTLWIGIDSALFFGGVGILKELHVNNVSIYQLLQLIPFLVLPICLNKIHYTHVLGAAILCKIIAIYAFFAHQPLLGFVALGINMALFNPLRYVISEYWQSVELKKMASLEGLTFVGMLLGVLMGGLAVWTSMLWHSLAVIVLLLGAIMYAFHVRPLPIQSPGKIQFNLLKKETTIVKSFLGTSLFFGIAGFLKSLIVMLVAGAPMLNGTEVSTKIIVLSNVFVITGVFLAKIIYQKSPNCPIGWGIPLGLCLMLMDSNPLSWWFLIGLNTLALSAGLFFVRYNFDLHRFSSGNDATYRLFLFQNLLENGSAIFFLSILSFFGVSNLPYFMFFIALLSSIIIFYLYQKKLEISYVPN